jgi:DNA recombination protein RmuC
MWDTASIVAIGLGVLAFGIALLSMLRGGASGSLQFLTRDQAAELFRCEHERLRDTLDGQFRAAREELAGRLDGGMGRVEGQARATHDKLDTELEKMATEASANRDRLRSTIEERLEKAGIAQGEAGKETRAALLQAVADQGKAATDRLTQIGDHQKERLEKAASAQAEATREVRDGLLQVVTDHGKAATDLLTQIGNHQKERLEKAAAAQTDAAKETRDRLLKAVTDQGKAATDLLTQIGNHQKERLEKAAAAQAEATKEARDGLLQAVTDQGKAATDLLTQIGQQQKERLDNVSSALTDLTKLQGDKLEAVRQAVEERLEALRKENSAKLEEMRQTVDEKLHATLETRLGESFNRVVEQLKLVYEGIGEMKSLANGVGDLKKVLSNVSVRGALGEIQLARILEQFLSPEQYIENAAVRENSQERVEFAIRLPGRDDENEVLLPIDAKFPQEDYQRLLEAAEIGDTEAVAAASQALETRIRQFAATIRSKYIVPPRTTDFAVLFLPTEGLYAEVLRRPGLFERLQRDHQVTLAGPTTLTALLNALQMGFRSLAIQKRSSEVWQVLGAVRTEFGKYNDVVEKIGKQLGYAANTVHELGRRTRAMDRKLRDVETLPAPQAEALLGFNGEGAADPNDAEDVEDAEDA